MKKHPEMDNTDFIPVEDVIKKETIDPDEKYFDPLYGSENSNTYSEDISSIKIENNFTENSLETKKEHLDKFHP